MRKWIDILSEAPVGNFDTMGYFDHIPGSFNPKQLHSDGSFRPTDQRIIQSPKAEAKIRRVLARVPQTIDLVFFELGGPVLDVRAVGDAIGGVFDREELRARFPQLPASSTPSAITLVMSHNEGLEAVQLSPWIIMHRMGHGCTMSEGSYYGNVFEEVVEYLSGIWREVSDNWAVDAIDTAKFLGTMKSAREKTLTQALELIFELFAQHCVQGHARLNRFTQDWLAENTIWPVEPSAIKRLNNQVGEAEEKINGLFQALLTSLEGKVVIL